MLTWHLQVDLQLCMPVLGISDDASEAKCNHPMEWNATFVSRVSCDQGLKMCPSAQEDIVELQEEVDASKRALQGTGNSTLTSLASGVMAPANTAAGTGAPGAVATPQAHLLDYVVDVLGRGNPELASLTSMTQVTMLAIAMCIHLFCRLPWSVVTCLVQCCQDR